MARSRPSNDNGQSYHSPGTLPPWERGNIAQVPYLDASSPSLSNAERDALPSLWAAQTNNTPTNHARRDTHTRYASDSSQRYVTTMDDYSSPWGVKTPLTAPPLPRPYDTPVYIPPAPKSTPNPPTFVKPPPTPPESEFGSSTTGSIPGSPPGRQEVKPLPTIPASVEPQQPSRARAASSTHESRKGSSRLSRWKSAIKDIFTSHPAEDGELEHISVQRHWTDE